MKYLPPKLRGVLLGQVELDSPSVSWDFDLHFFREKKNPCTTRRDVLDQGISHIDHVYPRRCGDENQNRTIKKPGPEDFEFEYSHSLNYVYAWCKSDVTDQYHQTKTGVAPVGHFVDVMNAELSADHNENQKTTVNRNPSTLRSVHTKTDAGTSKDCLSGCMQKSSPSQPWRRHRPQYVRAEFKGHLSLFMVMCVLSLYQGKTECWCKFPFERMRNPARRKRLASFASSSSFFADRYPPFVAIITEPDACSTDGNVQSTLRAIERAVATQHVDLISVRLQGNATTAPPETLERAHFLTKRLLELSRRRYPLAANEPILEERSTKRTNFYVVCSSDWVQVAVECRSHGIHVKEAHLKHIPDWIPLFDYDILIGTSAHSIESALKSSVLYRPHYYFVGTCFLTESHPEKSEAELEGPLLPGKIKESLRIDGRGDTNYSIPVFAIGGIDETNCCIPIEAGADGVAVIRSVLKADQPEYVVSIMYKIMKTTSMKRQRDLQIDNRV